MSIYDVSNLGNTILISKAFKSNRSASECNDIEL